MSRTYIDFHILQTVPPSNLNRDDTGSPKTATFGGVRRARVSSQAWKRATRREFQSVLDESELGERTKFVVGLIAEEITRLAEDLGGDAQSIAEKALEAAGIKTTRPKKKSEDEMDPAAETGYLLFLSRPQITALAELAVASRRAGEKAVAKKAAKEALGQGNSIDLALFGRMVAEDPGLNVDAACQVAHAISVHAVAPEFDYFTAVDDRSKEEHAGAGMIGTVEFNSSTLYRYATINADALAETLGSAEAAARAVEAFAKAFVNSMPTGKQNTFANRTRPDAVLVSVRDDQPVNLVGAFESPIEAKSGRVAEAVVAMAEYARDLDAAYASNPVASLALIVGPADSPDSRAAVGEYAEIVGLPAIIERVGALVRERGATE